MRRVCTVILLAALTQACTQWQAAEIAPSLASESVVRLTVDPGARIQVRRPVISGDTLRDVTGVRLPVSRIRGAEVRRVDGMATTMLVVGVVTAVALASILYTQGIDDLDLGVL